ncbi:MAG: acetyl-CoA carboxylase biotin carboxyl carrier protein [Ruminococcus sp.]|nr:acetyl-CoA carboxylase biotin carboxyl carrier protein [Ruminococcus sp.]
MENNHMNLEFIQKLADLVADKNLGEITVQNGDSTITVKGKKAAAQTVVESIPVAAAPLPAAPAAAPAPETKAAAPAGKFVKAPIVGTFYAASAPDQPPFVKVGDQIKKGDVLFIIESMKLMNEVQSEVEGTVAEILVGNGEAVEYDQPILRVE